VESGSSDLISHQEMKVLAVNCKLPIMCHTWSSYQFNDIIIQPLDNTSVIYFVRKELVYLVGGKLENSISHNEMNKIQMIKIIRTVEIPELPKQPCESCGSLVAQRLGLKTSKDIADKLFETENNWNRK